MLFVNITSAAEHGERERNLDWKSDIKSNEEMPTDNIIVVDI